MGKAKRRRLRRRKRKPTPPRCARQPLPREGARVDTPSFLWKEVPRRGGGWIGGSGMKKSGKDRLKCAVYESTRAPPKKKTNPASLRSAAPSKGRGSRGHSLLPMEGGAPKGRRLDGGSGMKKSGKDHLKCAVCESTRALPQKGSQPRLAALGSPFQEKGLAWTLPPSYGRRCPEGAEVGWEIGMKKRGEIISGRRFTKASSARKQLIKPIYSYKKRKSNAANDFNVIYQSGYR